VITALVRAVLRAPFTGRAVREVLFSLVGLTLSGCVVGLFLAVPVTLVAILRMHAGSVEGSGRFGSLVIAVLALLAMVLLAPRAARGLVALRRWSARRLLGAVLVPPPVARRGGPLGWFTAGARDRSGWRAVTYLVARLPVAVLDGYALLCALSGTLCLTYPLWWPLFRNHPPGVTLSPVPVLTPFGVVPVRTFPATSVAFTAGAAMVLAAPWVARAAATLDLALLRALTGPGRLAQRVRELEHSRAQVVEDMATLVRQLERNLHDGAQVQLTALALNLGRITEKLGQDGNAPDLPGARVLAARAHHNAKNAVTELRDLVRGLHPPVLDAGLTEALASLTAGSAIPAHLNVDIPVRPSPAIEAIAYFCVAELLTNAAKHSHATTIMVEARQHDGTLRILVTDNGAGGADPGRGTGLAGLAERVGAVDGRLDIRSTPDRGTRIIVELPLTT
jgi:signal transduction histidine kinase